MVLLPTVALVSGMQLFLFEHIFKISDNILQLHWITKTNKACPYVKISSPLQACSVMLGSQHLRWTQRWLENELKWGGRGLRADLCKHGGGGCFHFSNAWRVGLVSVTSHSCCTESLPAVVPLVILVSWSYRFRWLNKSSCWFLPQSSAVYHRRKSWCLSSWTCAHPDSPLQLYPNDNQCRDFSHQRVSRLGP